MTTLATCTIDGTEVLIVKEEDGLEFSVIGPMTKSILDQCQSIRDINAQAYFDRCEAHNATAPRAPRPQVKWKGLFGWFRSLAYWTLTGNSENGSHRVRS